MVVTALRHMCVVHSIKALKMLLCSLIFGMWEITKVPFNKNHACKYIPKNISAEIWKGGNMNFPHITSTNDPPSVTTSQYSSAQASHWLAACQLETKKGFFFPVTASGFRQSLVERTIYSSWRETSHNSATQPPQEEKQIQNDDVFVIILHEPCSCALEGAESKWECEKKNLFLFQWFKMLIMVVRRRLSVELWYFPRSLTQFYNQVLIHTRWHCVHLVALFHTFLLNNFFFLHFI